MSAHPMQSHQYPYAPIPAIIARIEARKARTARKGFLKLLRQLTNFSSPLGRKCAELANRLQSVHDASHSSGVSKDRSYRRIYDEYVAAFMAERAAQEPAPEASPMVPVGSLVVPLAGETGDSAGSGTGSGDGV